MKSRITAANTLRANALFNRRQFGVLAAGAAAMVAGRGASAQTADTGTVTILTWETYHDDSLLEAYTAKTGVNINAIRAGSVDEMYSTVRTGSVKPDIAYFDTGSMPRYIAAELIDTIDPSRVKNTDTILPSLDWQTFNNIGGNGIYGVPYAWGTQPLMYDADKMDTPTSWNVLWDPANKGRVSTFDDAYVNFPMVALKAGVADPYNLSDADFDLVTQALRELHPQIRTISRGYDDMANIFMAGDADVAYCQNISIAFELRSRGRNVQVTYPTEGTPAWVDNAVMTKTAGQRQEVYDFISEGLTTPWQGHFIQNGSNGILTEAEAKAAGVPDDVIAKTEIPMANDPNFWKGLSVLQSPEDFDRRLEIWNEFKAGLL